MAIKQSSCPGLDGMEKHKADPNHAAAKRPNEKWTKKGQTNQDSRPCKMPLSGRALGRSSGFSKSPETFSCLVATIFNFNPLRRAHPFSSQWLHLLLLWPRLPSRRSLRELTSIHASLLRVLSAARSLTVPSLLSMCMLTHELHTSAITH